MTSTNTNTSSFLLLLVTQQRTGKQLQIARQTSIAAAQKQVSDVISTIRETPDGESIQLQIMKKQQQPQQQSANNKEAAAISNAATTTDIVTIQPQRNTPDQPQTIGVFLGPNLKGVERIQSKNPIVALQLAWEYLSDICTQTFNGVISVLKTFAMGSGPPPGQSISGPIGLIKQVREESNKSPIKNFICDQTNDLIFLPHPFLSSILKGSNVVATKDWTAVFLFAAALSVNLGVLNALPLPALDGGQLVFVLAEALTGRKVDQRVQESITSAAVLFLLWVSAYAAFGDVGKIVSGVL